MLVLPQRITHDEAPACAHMLEQGLAGLAGQPHDSAVVDASALVQFDSSALAVLLEIRRQAAARGRGFAVRNLPARLRELAVLYGVAGLLPAAA
ncbi:MAG: STAS domain-containing protein [Burkholderiaceae bacterium]|jgi:phospholipid transport system transporter-binding protein|nr:STAS domain-containing protein [Burkholderiaceae bacterium]